MVSLRNLLPRFSHNNLLPVQLMIGSVPKSNPKQNHTPSFSQLPDQDHIIPFEYGFPIFYFKIHYLHRCTSSISLSAVASKDHLPQLTEFTGIGLKNPVCQAGQSSAAVGSGAIIKLLAFSQAFKAFICSGLKELVSILLIISTEKASRISLWSGKFEPSGKQVHNLTEDKSGKLSSNNPEKADPL